MGKLNLAFLGVLFVGLATFIQMIVDWYQSEAYGISYPILLKILVIAATVLTLLAIWLGFKGQRVRR